MVLTVDSVIKLCQVPKPLLLTFNRLGISIILSCFQFFSAKPSMSRFIIAYRNVVLTCETYDVAHFSLVDWLCTWVNILLYAGLLVLLNQSMMTAFAYRDRQLFHFIFLAAFREFIFGNRLHVHRKDNKSALVLPLGFDLDLSTICGHDCLADRQT